MRARSWLVLFTVALALRISAAAWRPLPMDGDQRLYTGLAESMVRGEGYVCDGMPQTTVHPLLPSLHAAMLHVVPSPRLAGIVLTILIGSLVPVATGGLVTSVLGFRFGIVVAALLAIQPNHVRLSGNVEPDLLAALLLAWLARLVWNEDWTLAGFVAGFAYLNRPEMLFLTPLLAVGAALRSVGWGRIVAFGLASLSVASVFLLFVWSATGRFTLTGKDQWQYLQGVHQFRSRGGPLDPTGIPELREEIGSPLHHIAAAPEEFAMGYLYRSGLFAHHLLRQLFFVLAPFSILGLIHAWRTSPRGGMILALPVCVAPIYPVVGTFFRHTVVVAPAVLALAGIGLVLAFDRAVDGFRKDPERR